MRTFALALLLVVSAAYRSQSRHQLDSLIRKIKNNPLNEDTLQVKNFHEIASAFNRINLDSSKNFADKTLALSLKLNYRRGICNAYNALGIYYHLSGQFDSAILNYQKSKDLKVQIGDKKAAVSSQNNIGIVYYLQGKYDNALETFNVSLKMQEGMKDTIGIPNTLNYIASVHYFLSNFEKALAYYLKALGLYKRTNDMPGMSQAYNNIGIIYSSLNNEDKAIENYNNSLSYANKIGAKDLVTTCYNNMGTVFQKRKDYTKALQFFTRSLELSRELRLTEGIALNLEKIGQIMEVQNRFPEALANYEEALAIQEKSGQAFNTASNLQSMGDLYSKMNKPDDAVRCYIRALKIAKELRTKNLIADISQDYGLLLKKEKDFKNAYYYFTEYSAIKDSILNEEKNKSLAEMQTRFDVDTKEKEIALLTKTKSVEELKIGEQQENIQKQRVTIYASASGVALLLVLSFFVFRSYSEKKKSNALLEVKNRNISEQKKVIEQKNNLITNSIEYAKNIQTNILPEDKLFNQLFPESFVLFLPKDVVSGDFYWVNSVNKNETILAAIDCVGHGVPGAFMALHCYNLLERIIKENKNISPAEILDNLNTAVIKSLHQNNEHTSSKHGMDLAMVKIKNKEIEFAGARNPLIIVSPNGEMNEIRADRMFVGGALGNFTNNKVNPEAGSMIYMFTDGYADQKGGPANEKYFITVFKELLISVAFKDVEQQKQVLKKTFDEWRVAKEQMDDVLVIGIRIK